jgi:hypothetical protein
MKNFGHAVQSYHPATSSKRREAAVTSAVWFVTLEASAKIRASKIVFGS